MDTRTQILDSAERAMRLRGYHAVSFRDLADELGIKSASIHYHFRHKEDLGFALVDRYAACVSKSVGPVREVGWPEAVDAFGSVYRNALHIQELQCLCGMLAAESAGLPEKVSKRVTAFFEHNIAWLVESMPESFKDKRSKALRIQAEVQGAMTLAVSLSDPTILDASIHQLVQEAKEHSRAI